MKLTKVAATVLAVIVAMPSCAVAAAQGQGPALTPRERADYVLDRLGYGPRPGDLARVMAMGPRAYIDRQLDPASIPENPRLAAELARADDAAHEPRSICSANTARRGRLPGTSALTRSK